MALDLFLTAVATAFAFISMVGELLCLALHKLLPSFALLGSW